MCGEIPANSVVPLPHCADLKSHCSLSLCLSLSTKALSVLSSLTLRPTELGNLTLLKEKKLLLYSLSGPSLLTYARLKFL